MTIGERIRAERLKKAWNQEHLATLLHVSRSTVSSWEVGRNTPDLETIVLISDLFGISLDHLLREDKHMLHTENKQQFTLKKSDEAFDVTNEEGITCYHMQEASTLPTQRKYLLTDQTNKQIASIKRKRYSFGMYDLPRLFLKLDHWNDISIIKDMEQFKSVYKIKGEDLSIEGHFLGETFAVVRNGETISNVVVTSDNNHFTFRFTCLNEPIEPLVVSFLFLIVLVYEEEKRAIHLG